mmetsp:Transcript_6989/g.14142  ORF Transcript_6989/g.14142 Transcript_6989/m.14142 type:complete len:234 (+) Transcript_6989:942-1643(+)
MAADNASAHNSTPRTTTAVITCWACCSACATRGSSCASRSTCGNVVAPPSNVWKFADSVIAGNPSTARRAASQNASMCFSFCVKPSMTCRADSMIFWPCTGNLDNKCTKSPPSPPRSTTERASRMVPNSVSEALSGGETTSKNCLTSERSDCANSSATSSCVKGANVATSLSWHSAMLDALVKTCTALSQMYFRCQSPMSSSPTKRLRNSVVRSSAINKPRWQARTVKYNPHM